MADGTKDQIGTAVIQSKPRSAALNTQHYREQVYELTEDARSFRRKALEEMLAVVTSDETSRTSLFIGVDFTSRTRTRTFKANPVLSDDADDVSIEGAEWVSVKPNTSLEHLWAKYGDRLLFYTSCWHQRKLSILCVDVIDAEQRSIRVLVRKAAPMLANTPLG